jgi:hypothetical protein
VGSRAGLDAVEKNLALPGIEILEKIIYSSL